MATGQGISIRASAPYTFDARVVRNILYHFSIQNQLLEMENDRLQEALNQQKKDSKRSRALPLI
jgi:hypothetical protein